jgi:hypothetical protein
MVQLDQLKALASDLRRKLKQVDQLTGRSGERWKIWAGLTHGDVRSARAIIYR